VRLYMGAVKTLEGQARDASAPKAIGGDK
jgi:hypothetical protein